MIYTCTQDYQGYWFGVGRSGDIEYWKDVANEWDETGETSTVFGKMTEREIIDLIQDLYDIEIVEDADGSIAKRIEEEDDY